MKASNFSGSSGHATLTESGRTCLHGRSLREALEGVPGRRPRDVPENFRTEGLTNDSVRPSIDEVAKWLRVVRDGASAGVGPQHFASSPEVPPLRRGNRRALRSPHTDWVVRACLSLLVAADLNHVGGCNKLGPTPMSWVGGPPRARRHCGQTGVRRACRPTLRRQDSRFRRI
jgi:hypothetical protein